MDVVVPVVAVARVRIVDERQRLVEIEGRGRWQVCDWSRWKSVEKVAFFKVLTKFRTRNVQADLLSVATDDVTSVVTSSHVMVMLLLLL